MKTRIILSQKFVEEIGEYKSILSKSYELDSFSDQDPKWLRIRQICTEYDVLVSCLSHYLETGGDAWWDEAAMLYRNIRCLLSRIR